MSFNKRVYEAICDYPPIIDYHEEDARPFVGPDREDDADEEDARPPEWITTRNNNGLMPWEE